MKVMTDVGRSIAANTTSANILVDKPEVYLSRNSALAFYLVAAAVGIFATVLVGDSVVVEDQEISGANRFPIRPDDLFARSGGAQGDLILIRLRNSTGAAILVTSVVDVQSV